ncbi:hypothetical protein HOD05_01300 [Candidatus Woesearchaeota archaeon]|jgi:hypothetical protein|nr:hypothetical protein [Candidatus Woesearchaeota archaeon]MBT4151042.1 hypothetical protein [Candidatus Woesearchaeota archaeon]MBT4433832.1 hypothetical protein [Candidatus Woesearchaeota archaeon]MBT7332169.1 hypothetical protein [Candidatus Woesearchaeota archaeon]
MKTKKGARCVHKERIILLWVVFAVILLFVLASPISSFENKKISWIQESLSGLVGPGNLLTGAVIGTQEYGTFAEGDEDTTLWDINISSTGNNPDSAVDLVINSEDHVFVVGNGSNLQGITTASDWWIKSFLPDGTENTTWDINVSEGLPGTAESATGVTLDSNNNLYVIGYLNDFVDLPSQKDWVVKKYFSNATEDLNWDLGFSNGDPPAGDDIPYDVANDSNDNIFVVGMGTNLDSGSSGEDWWIKKMNSSGVENTSHWDLNFTSDGTQSDIAYALAVDSSDNVFVVGTGNGLNAPPATGADWWIKKFDSDGTENTTHWDLNYSNAIGGDEIAYDIAIDSNGNVFVVGVGQNLAGFTSGSDWWIKKFDSDGTENTTHWDKNFSGSDSAYESAYGVTVDSNDDVYVVGAFVAGNNAANTEWLIKKFLANGTEDTSSWNLTNTSARSFDDTAYAVAVNSENNVTVVGEVYDIDLETKGYDWWIKSYEGNFTAAESPSAPVGTLGNFFDDFTNSPNATHYQNETLQAIEMTFEHDSTNEVITFNASVVGGRSTHELFTLENITMADFNATVNITIENTSSSLSASTFVTASLALINQSDSDFFNGCQVNIDDTGETTLSAANTTGGFSSNLSETNVAPNGTMYMEFYSDTNLLNCTYDGQEASILVEMDTEFAFGVRADIAPGTPTGDVNITFDELNYSLGKIVPAESVDCGLIATDTTMNQDVTTIDTCFSIISDDISLDCAGYSIEFATTSEGHGVNITGRDNVTVENCVIEEGAANGISAVLVESSANITLQNNNITTIGDSVVGIESGDNTNLSNYIDNNITTTNNGYTIYIAGQDNNITDNILTATTGAGIRVLWANGDRGIYQGNTIVGNPASAIGIEIDGQNNSILNNDIFVDGTSAWSIRLSSSDFNLIDSNNLTATNTGGIGIYMIGTSDNNTLINNNITASTVNELELSDETGDSYTNVLIYNNSFGQINWTKTNLTTAQNLSVGITVFLEDNNIGVLDDETNMQNLNTSAEIQLFGLTSYTSTPQLLKNGVRCDNGDSCNISFDATNDILYANVSSFSNYTTLTNDVICGNLTSDTTMSQDLTNDSSCFTFGASDITLDCAGYQVNSTGEISLSAVFMDNTINTPTYENITLQNCDFRHFPNNIIFLSVNHSRVSNITLVNGSSGFDVFNSTIENITAISGNMDIILGNLSTFENINLTNDSVFGVFESYESIFHNITVVQTSDNAISLTSFENNNLTDITIYNVSDTGNDGVLLASSGVHRNNFERITIQNSAVKSVGLASGDNNTFFNSTFSNITEGFVLTGSSAGNIFTNVEINVSGIGVLSMDDTSSGNNTLMYNNSFGLINWTKTSLVTLQNLSVGTTIFLENNTVGVLDDEDNMDQLNTSSKIELHLLNYSETPQLLKNGVRCDNTNACNISYSSITKVLSADISSFSNYTTQDAVPDTTTPTITVEYPTNNSKQNETTIALNFTVADDESVDACWYSLDDGANTTIASCANTTITPGRGPHNLTVYVNDTSNNMNNSGRINFTINNFPTLSNLVLNTTDQTTNNTNQNLTASWTSSDEDGDSIRNITNWLLNGSSIAVLYLPFEGGSNSTFTKDYSTFSNNATVSGATYNITGFKNSHGSYQLDGIDDYLNVSHNESLNITEEITIMFWVQDPVSEWGDNYTETSLTATYANTGCTTTDYSGSDDAMRTATLGFDFPFFDRNISDTDTVYMDTNGRISFDDSTSDFGPDATEMQNEENIAANWQDYGGASENNEHICTNQGVAPNKWASFAWDSSFYNGAGTVQAEIILYQNGTIDIIYGTIAAHADTWYRGISNGTGSDYAYTTDTTLSGAESNTAFRYTPPAIVAAEGSETSNRTLVSKAGSYTIQMKNMTVSAYINGTDEDSVTLTIDKNWTHLAMTYNGSDLKLYKNGALANNTSFSATIESSISDVIIGDLINGSMDEVYIFNRSLSANQISAMYNNQTDIIVSQETSEDDNWTVEVTPNDGFADGETSSSGELIVLADNNPTILDLIPALNSQYNTLETIEIAVNVTDDVSVSQVYANVSLSNGTIEEVELSFDSNNRYNNTYTIPVSVGGIYNITFIANDTAGNYNTTNITNFTVVFTDTDSDGSDDLADTLIGNESDILTQGISGLNITVGGNQSNGTFTGVHEVLFYNETTLFINFTHNFSSSGLNLSNFTINFTSTSLVMNFSEQIQSEYNKTFYFPDNGYTSICVENAEINSDADISSGCNGDDETNFDTCLGVSTGTTINSITCYDNGTTITIQNLSFSGIRGTTTSAAVTPPAADSGSPGGSPGSSLPPSTDASESSDSTDTEGSNSETSDATDSSGPTGAAVTPQGSSNLAGRAFFGDFGEYSEQFGRYILTGILAVLALGTFTYGGRKIHHKIKHRHTLIHKPMERAPEMDLRLVPMTLIDSKEPMGDKINNINKQLAALQIDEVPIPKNKKRSLRLFKNNTKEVVLANELQNLNNEIHGYDKPQVIDEPLGKQEWDNQLEEIEIKLDNVNQKSSVKPKKKKSFSRFFQRNTKEVVLANELQKLDNEIHGYEKSKVINEPQVKQEWDTRLEQIEKELGTVNVDFGKGRVVTKIAESKDDFGDTQNALLNKELDHISQKLQGKEPFPSKFNNPKTQENAGGSELEELEREIKKLKEM